MKPNTPTLAIITGLISRSPDPISRYHFQLNIAVQRLYCIVGLHIKRSAQRTKLRDSRSATGSRRDHPVGLNAAFQVCGNLPRFPKKGARF
jgi:hypothetical protein